MSTSKESAPFITSPADGYASLSQGTVGPPAPVEPDPNNPPWGFPGAILAWLVSGGLLFIMPIPFVIPYALYKGVSLDKLGEFSVTDKTAILLQIVAVIPAHLLTLGVLWVIVTQFGRYPFWRTLGWSWGAKFGLWPSISLAVILFIVGTLLIMLFGGPETQLDKIINSSRATGYATALLASSTAPLVEEIVYRGVLYSSLQRLVGRIWSVALVLALFTLVHVPQYWPNFGVIAAVGLLSLFLTVVRAYTGRLLPCFVMHLVFNFIQSVLIVFQPFLPQFGEQKATIVLLLAGFPGFF